MIKAIHETIHVLDLPNGNHCCKQTPNKLGYSRLDHGLYKVAYLAKSYSIPLAFVVNSNQTRIHLVLNANEKTLEPKGMKHVQVLSLEDMKQVTMVVSSSTTNGLLPPQIMFISSIFKTLQPYNKRKTNCINDG